MNISKEEFEKITMEALSSIPEKFLAKLENIEIVIEDRPSPYQINKLARSQREKFENKKIMLFGLYEGVPQTKRYHYGEVLPDKITIFKKPIEESASSKKDLREIVRNTIWHEIAHHFGMSEEEVKKAEDLRKRQRTKEKK